MSFQTTPVTLLIIIATAGFSLYTIYKNQALYERFLLSPYRIYNQRSWYLMITSGFLHADMFHLMFNMLTLYFFAPLLEMRVGPLDFIVIYFGSMFLANISTVLKYRNDPYYAAVGASGAVSGVIFASILYYPGFKIYLYFAIGIPAPLFAVLYLVWCWYAARHAQDNINHEAHFWGAAAGAALAIAMNPRALGYFISQIIE